MIRELHNKQKENFWTTTLFLCYPPPRSVFGCEGQNCLYLMVIWIIRQATLRWCTRKNGQYKYWVKGKKRDITSHGNEEEFHLLDLVAMDALGFLSGLGNNLLHSPWLPGMSVCLAYVFSECIYLFWWPVICLFLCERTVRLHWTHSPLLITHHGDTKVTRAWFMLPEEETIKSGSFGSSHFLFLG